MKAQHVTQKRPAKRRRSCLGCLGRVFLLFFWLVFLVAITASSFLVSFLLFPPFGHETSARVLLIGLDKEERGVSRSDTIMLYAAKLNGQGATLISVPRDARVMISGHRRYSKINAAYAEGEHELLQKTLLKPDVMAADLPYYIVFDSQTVANMIDAIGGIDVVVERDMDYDDNWGNLHIHLKAGNRHLNGTKAVGYLRWRKNNHGRGASDDFSRAERQRKVMVAIKEKLRTWDGIKRLPKLYEAFNQHAKTNLTLPQLLMLAWNSRQMHTEAVPGVSRPIRGVSYVICDWEAGRRIWQNAVR